VTLSNRFRGLVNEKHPRAVREAQKLPSRACNKPRPPLNRGQLARPIDGVDETDVLLGNSAGTATELLRFISRDRPTQRWTSWRIILSDVHPTSRGPQHEPRGSARAWRWPAPRRLTAQQCIGTRIAPSCRCLARLRDPPLRGSSSIWNRSSDRRILSRLTSGDSLAVAVRRSLSCAVCLLMFNAPSRRKTQDSEIMGDHAIKHGGPIASSKKAQEKARLCSLPGFLRLPKCDRPREAAMAMCAVMWLGYGATLSRARDIRDDA